MDKKVPTTHHTAEHLQATALAMVAAYYNTFLIHDTTLGELKTNEIFVVWFCKTLQNWKALVATHRPDSLYFEVTRDGDQKRTYIDQYVKIDNFTIYDEEPAVELPKSFGPVEFLSGDKHPDDITGEPEKYPAEWRPTGVDNSGTTKLVEKLEEYRGYEELPKKRELPQVFQTRMSDRPDRSA